jgi:BirA family biotin operon repressor/biotin-[acetyl-CoA-carboxylase] ligase
MLADAGADAGPSRHALDAARIARSAGLPQAAVRVLDEIDSTNRALMEAGWPPVPADPVLLVARRQTAGRGRLGRTWISGDDDSLTMSVALELALPDAASRLAALPVLAGVGLAECLADRVDGLALKWPNDLQRRGRKVAGLLCESRLFGERIRVVAGLGINLLPAPHRLDALGQPAGALFDDPQAMPARSRLAGELAGVLIAAIAGESRARAPLHARWARFDALAGRPVDILSGGVVRDHGVAVGIDEGGALRLSTDAGLRLISAGEVSVRRRPDPESTA